MGLRDRLEKLEAIRKAATEKQPRHELSWAYEKILRMNENRRREQEGLEPLPLVRAEEEAALEMEDLEHTLAVTIPTYRQGRGYQSGEGKEFLDRWEQETREKLQQSGVDPE